ncbi:helix-turn-helix domain-containing protein [Mammaliicoccus sciuri]|nr:helix-turn-helix transcriptional regulator [Mammaliicoccus sciuri]
MNNDLGRKLKIIRLQNGLTQEEFGDRFLGTKSLVSKWESGRNRPNPERLRKIANFANITVEELLKDAEEPPHLAVGKRIRSIRLKHGMSMAEFGNYLSASKGNVATWEKGISLPNKSRIKSIAKLGSMPIDELLDITNYEELYALEKERNSLLEQEIQVLKEQLNLLNKKDTSTKVSK